MGDMGLSSSAYLHNPFVILETMSLSEFKGGGRGWQICYGIHQTPFGACLIATTPRGICNLHFLDSPDQDAPAQLLCSEWPRAELIQDQQTTQEICDRAFKPTEARSRPLVLCVKGTDFQIQVWRALLKIPFGRTITYQELADAIDRPTATRAVASAVARNSVGYLIPCHRVIRTSGELGGFRWGLQRKTALLNWEASYVSKSDDEGLQTHRYKRS